MIRIWQPFCYLKKIKDMIYFIMDNWGRNEIPSKITNVNKEKKFLIGFLK